VNETSSSNKPNWLITSYVVLIFVGVVLLVMGVIEWNRGEGTLLLALGVLGVIIPASLLPIAAVLLGATSGGSMEQKLDQVSSLLEKISERMLISDAAKRIAYREQDRQALRAAIREDVNKQDYDAAMVLVEEMRKTYGYREEAEAFQEEIEAARKAGREQKITEAISRIDKLITDHQWEQAHTEAAKIRRLYRESPRVEHLERRVKEAREAHKHHLERQFLEAANRDDVETAMSLLKELDQYLTEKEAAPYLEAARGVITKKRDNLGVQFKLAISDKNWRTALAAGNQIIREFPKSKMAEEVRSMIETLRERAATQPRDEDSGEYEAIDETSPPPQDSPSPHPAGNESPADATSSQH